MAKIEKPRVFMELWLGLLNRSAPRWSLKRLSIISSPMFHIVAVTLDYLRWVGILVVIHTHPVHAFTSYQHCIATTEDQTIRKSEIVPNLYLSTWRKNSPTLTVAFRVHWKSSFWMESMRRRDNCHNNFPLMSLDFQSISEFCLNKTEIRPLLSETTLNLINLSFYLVN